MPKIELDIPTDLLVPILVIWEVGSKRETVRAFKYQNGAIAFRGFKLHFSKADLYCVSVETQKVVDFPNTAGNYRAQKYNDTLGITPFLGDLPPNIALEVINRRFRQGVFVNE